MTGAAGGSPKERRGPVALSGDPPKRPTASGTHGNRGGSADLKEHPRRVVTCLPPKLRERPLDIGAVHLLDQR